MEVAQLLSSLALLHPQRKPISAALEADLRSIIKKRRYKKKQLLLHEDQVPEQVWYIIKGTTRMYYYESETAREITTWFWHEGDFIIPLREFITGHEHGENIELLEDSLLLSIPIKELWPLCKKYPDYQILQSIVLDINKARAYTHLCRLLSLNSKQRYEKLVEEHKDIFSKAFVKDIACFLNVHPTYLSALRTGRLR